MSEFLEQDNKKEVKKWKDIGAFWVQKSEKGDAYLQGYLDLNGEKIPLTVFKNNYKKAPGQPDYRVYPKGSKGVE